MNNEDVVIKVILDEVFEKNLYKIAAEQLFAVGCTSKDFNKFLKTPVGKTIPSDQQCNVMNEMINIEREH